jgi:uncharacterized protein (TIGR02453 family)
MGFTGFPAEAVSFYEGLEADNSKEYWTAGKAIYERAVRGPMEALLADLDDEFGPFHLFRPYRDVRFAKDKTPYKTACAAVGEAESGAIFYVQVSAGGLMVGSGAYHLATDQLTRYREAVDDDDAGGALERIVADDAKAGYTLHGIDLLKTAPRGYPKDHPRIELLRRKGLAVGRQWPVAKWLHTAKARDRVVEGWRAAEPLNAWLAAHVGPSELPPNDAW